MDAVDEVRLAGAFGSQIDAHHAMVLGLIPDCDLDRVASAGNAAGTGALIALLSAAARAEIEDVVRRVDKIETAVEPRFQDALRGRAGHPAPDRRRTRTWPASSTLPGTPGRSVGAGQDERTERRPAARCPSPPHEEDR